MPLKNLVDAQCGQVNPLVSLTHHITKDKAHKETSFFKHKYPGNDVAADIPLSPELLAEEFLRETRSIAFQNPQSFRMDHLLKEMREIERTPPALSPSIMDIAANSKQWQDEYMESNRILSTNSVRPKVDPCLSMASEGSLDWQREFLLNNGKSGAAWEADYMGLLSNLSRASGQQESKIGQIAAIKPAEAWETEFAKDNLNIKNEKSLAWAKEFEKAREKGSLAEVEIDSEALSASEREEFWRNLQSGWEEMANRESSSTDHPWLSDFETDFSEPFKQYSFQKENALKDHPDPLAEGKRRLEMGDIPSAILCFEAAVQNEGHHAEAWLLLGSTHAANEQDPSAIPALKRGLELDPSNLKGWMSLASSYTNESYQNHALKSLTEWIKNNEQYKHLASTMNQINSDNFFVSSVATREFVDTVQELYIRAANSKGGQVDPDVQCGLGVLFNLTGDYDKAVDCFKAALQVNPSDSHLWNKLGATLANSNRSVDAIDAYRRALEISPGFIRCRYNLGITCINLQAHREAVDHFLEALSMQQKSLESGRFGDNSSSLVASDNIWSTLRVCLRSLDAQHLFEYVDSRNLAALLKEFSTK